MEEAFLRSQKLKYKQETYNQWNQLPPNIPLPNSRTLSMLSLTFHKLLYLNQANSDQQPLQLKLQWWGMKKPHSLIYDQISPCQGKYLICTPDERLLSYFNDMKLLSIEVCNRYRGIGKAYLNFMVLKGWKGELFEGQIDIKQGNRKIGELSYTIELTNIHHPFINEPVKQAEKMNQKQPSIRINPNSGQEVTKRFIINDQPSIRNAEFLHEETSKKKVETSKRLITKQIIKQQSNHQQSIANEIMDTYPRFKTKKDDFVYEQPIFRASNEGKYEAELIRLVEDYNLLIGKPSFMPTSSKSQSENNIEIEILKIQGKDFQESSQIQISVPMIDGNANLYRLFVGGLIKLQFPSNTSEAELLNYVKSCVILFKKGQKVEGSIKLSKVLANCNETLQIGLFQRQGKKQNKKQKGSCWIRAVPPPKPAENIVAQPVIYDKTDIQTEQKKPQMEVREVSQQEYILLNLKNYNSIQQKYRNRTCNMFIRILCDEEWLGETNTLWNTNSAFSINEKVTYKIRSKRLTFQLCDRQKTLLKMGAGQLIMNGPLGINLEIPLKTRYMNSQTIIGYISLDYFKNGLQSISKMVGILNEKEKEKPFQQAHRQKIIPNQKQHIIDELPQQKHEEIITKKDTIEDNKENEMQMNRMEQQRLNQYKKMPVYQQKLGILDVFNKIFPYFYSNSQIMTTLLQKDDHKVTQFLQVFNVLITRSIIPNSSLNELITHFLFKAAHANNINKVNTLAFRECYDAFKTYYEQIVEEKDNHLKVFLQILEDSGLSINDLEFQLRNQRRIWPKLNDLFSFRKGKHINIIEDLKASLQHTSNTFDKHGVVHQLSATQFCDILRKYEVYETTLGSEIDTQLLCERIYRNTVLLLEEIQPNIELYSYNELVTFLRAEEIILSTWQMLNLQEYLTKFGIKKTLPKYPNFTNRETQNYSGRFRQPQHNGNNDKFIRNGGESHRPAISKSPTFGHLHQPQQMKAELLTSQNYMVDSLAIKMQNLAISPINYNSNETNFGQIKANISNLKCRLLDLYINDLRIAFDSSHSQTVNNYQSNSMNQEGQSREFGSSKEVRQRDESATSQKYSIEPRVEQESYKSGSVQGNQQIQLKLDRIERAFSYRVQLQFEQLEELVQLQCLHNEWAAIVSEQGDYIGGILIN